MPVQLVQLVRGAGEQPFALARSQAAASLRKAPEPSRVNIPQALANPRWAALVAAAGVAAGIAGSIDGGVKVGITEGLAAALAVSVLTGLSYGTSHAVAPAEPLTNDLIFGLVLGGVAGIATGLRMAAAGDPACVALLPIAGLLESSAVDVEALPRDFWLR